MASFELIDRRSGTVTRTSSAMRRAMAVADCDILILGCAPRVRLGTHLDVDGAAIDRAVGAFKEFFALRGGARCC